VAKSHPVITGIGSAIDTTDPAVTEGTGPHWLLIRRRISDGEYAFYRACAPCPGPWPS
jgi:hypothetical protein